MPKKNKTLKINYLKQNDMANTMKLDLVQEMVTNYKTRQLLSILTNTINPMTFDAQSVWFDINALKTFISTIEGEVAKHPEYGLKDFGVRFYYSAYPKNELFDEPGYEELADLPANYEKLHTLIAVPTAEINGVNSDFDPYDTKTYDGTKPTGTGLMIMAENHGGLTPPNPQVGLWF
jgi:hypothetical protein